MFWLFRGNINRIFWVSAVFCWSIMRFATIDASNIMFPCWFYLRPLTLRPRVAFCLLWKRRWMFPPRYSKRQATLAAAAAAHHSGTWLWFASRRSHQGSYLHANPPDAPQQAEDFAVSGRRSRINWWRRTGGRKYSLFHEQTGFSSEDVSVY